MTITPAGMPATGTPPALPDPSAPPAEAPPVAPEETPPAAPMTEETPAADAPPPWGSDEEFDPAKAWSLIQNLRTDKANLQEKVQPLLDAQEEARRAELGELATVREDLDKTAAVATSWQTRAVTAEFRALVGDKFQDIEDAKAFVGDLSGFIVGDDIDTAALQARIDQLVAAKPYLLKQQQTPPPQGFTPDRGQGQSGTGQIPIDERIRAAQASGDFATSIALKQAKFLNP